MLTIDTCDGIQHKIPRHLALQSPFFSTILSFSETSDDTDAIPLPSITAEVFAWAMEFVRRDSIPGCRLGRIARPLPSADLLEAGVPEWANDFLITKVPFGTCLLELAEAAEFLRLNMLVSLCCARIASKIKQGLCSAVFDDGTKLSSKDEADMKAQNSWAWESLISDVVSSTEYDDGGLLSDGVIEAQPLHAIADVKAASAEEEAAGLVAIVTDPRISGRSSTKTSEERFRLLSPLAGKIALFL